MEIEPGVLYLGTEEAQHGYYLYNCAALFILMLIATSVPLCVGCPTGTKGQAFALKNLQSKQEETALGETCAQKRSELPKIVTGLGFEPMFPDSQSPSHWIM